MILLHNCKVGNYFDLFTLLNVVLLVRPAQIQTAYQQRRKNYNSCKSLGSLLRRHDKRLRE